MARRRDEFEEFSISRFLTRPFKVFWEWGSGLGSDDRIRDRQTSPVVSLLLAPIRFLFACILFLINSWATSRHIRPFLLSIPMLLAVTGVAGAVWLDYFRFPNKVARTQKYYETFLYDPDRGPKIAQHFALKSVALQPNNPTAKFNLAMVWEALGASPEAVSEAERFLAGYRAEDLMNSLAENDYSMAHVWLARRLLFSETNLSPKERSEKIDHPSTGVESDPERPLSPQAEEMLTTAEAAGSELTVAFEEREAIDAKIAKETAGMTPAQNEEYQKEKGLDDQRDAALALESQATAKAAEALDELAKLGPELSKNPREAARTLDALGALGSSPKTSGKALVTLSGLRRDPVVADAVKAQSDFEQVTAWLHLLRALELDAENDAAKIAKADLFLSKATRFEEGSEEYKGLLLKAKEQYDPLIQTNLNIIIGNLPKVMKVLGDLDDTRDAQEQFQKIKKQLYQHMRRFPADENIPQIWGILIGAAIQLKDYEGAEEIIKEGFSQTNDPSIKQMFGLLSDQLLIVKVNDLKVLESPEQFDAALDILSKGIEASPTSRPISDRLVQFIFPDANGDGKVLSEQFEKTKTVGAPVHLLKGILKVMKGNAQGGKTHWEIAADQSPNSQRVLFSLIRSLMTGFDDQFENRRDVMALAIEQFPDQGLFYFLRGSDSLNQGSYADAIVDFEQAAQMIAEPENFEVHMRLARCYKALQDQEKFDVQRRKLQSMIQRVEPGQRQMLEDNLSKLDED